MKGSGIGALYTVASLTLIVMIITFLSSTIVSDLGFKQDIENRFAIRYDVHTSDNALKAAKIYMKTAARYSFYQAAYSVFRQGGFDEPGDKRSYRYWFDSFGSVNPPSESEVMKAIESNTQKNLNIYGSAGYNFMTEFSVSIPEYDVTVIDSSALKTFSLKASSNKNMAIVKGEPTGEIISLEAKSGFDDNLEINLKGLYDEALVVYSKVQNKLENEMKDITPSGACFEDYSNILTGGPKEKADLKAEIMAIDLTETPTSTDYSYEISMVHSDAKRTSGAPCKHTLLGIAKVVVKSEKISLAVINEDGPNFAPAEMAFLIRYGYTNDGKLSDDNLELLPADVIEIPKETVPVSVMVIKGMSSKCVNNHQYDSIISKASGFFGVDTALIRAVICRESDFNPSAGSSAGAVGLMQIIPSTFNNLKTENHCIKTVGADQWKVIVEKPTSSSDPREDPYQSIMRGTCYIASLYDDYSDMDSLSRLRCTLASYNGGPGRLDKIINGYGIWRPHGCDPMQIKLKETREYVATITSWLGVS